MENIRCESKPNRQFIRPPNINTTSKEGFYRIQISGHGTNAYLLRVYLKQKLALPSFSDHLRDPLARNRDELDILISGIGFHRFYTFSYHL